MKPFLLLSLLVVLMSQQFCQGADEGAPTTMRWTQLAPIPDRLGFAGSYVGVSNGALLVAGEANFPDAPHWAGGTKVWYDSVFVLPHPEAQWQTGLRLPSPRGYGVSFTTADGIILAGGSDDQRHLTDVTQLVFQDGKLLIQSLPELPSPCAMMCGVQQGTKLYLAGGITSPDSTEATRSFWVLDLSSPTPQWERLPDCPGPGRMLATMGVLNNSIYLFSGAALTKGPEGKPVRQWLQDAYRFDHIHGWTRLPDLPRVAVAAPSPAFPLNGSALVIQGGDDGKQLQATPEQHQGFPKSSLIFNTEHQSWTIGPVAPFSLVTTSTAQWNGGIVIPGGEIRPGVRSTEVWWGQVTKAKERQPAP